SDLTEISFAAIIHDTRPTDDFQIGDLRQLGQDVVLHAIDKGGVLFLLAQIFERQNGDSGRYWTLAKLTFPNGPPSCRCQSDKHRHKQCATRITPRPLSAAAYDSSVSR